MDGLVTFHGSYAAMRAERALERAGLAHRLIPGPRDISPHCGVALQFRLADREAVEAALAAAKVEVEAFHAYRLSPESSALLERSGRRGADQRARVRWGLRRRDGPVATG